MKTPRLAMLLARLPVLGLLLLASLLVPPTVRADTTDCTVITALPYRMDAPGHYCLGQNLTLASGIAAPAIHVAADHVTLDCNGYSISNGNATDARHGLYAVVAFTEVRNCTFNDFARGIVLQGAHQARLQDNAVVRARVLGINVSGYHAFLLDNEVIDTVGCQAIYVSTGNVGLMVVKGNIIRGLTCASGTPTGIVVTGGGRAVVQENRLEGFGVTGVTAQSFGVLISSATSVPVPALVEDNHFYLMKSTSHVAIVKTTAAQKGRCKGNLSPGIATTNTGCL
jgi:hypothetical protein